MTEATLIAHVPELVRLSRRVISVLIGVALVNCGSGQMRGMRTIFGGRGQMRRGLYMVALANVRFNATIKRLYNRLVAAKNPRRPPSLLVCASS